MIPPNYEKFQKLVEQLESEMTISEICKLNNVNYHSFITWRYEHGYSRKYKKPKAPTGLIEAEVTNIPSSIGQSAGRANVRIEFENGLLFERMNIEVDTLLEFIYKLRPALCLS